MRYLVKVKYVPLVRIPAVISTNQQNNQNLNNNQQRFQPATNQNVVRNSGRQPNVRPANNQPNTSNIAQQRQNMYRNPVRQLNTRPSNNQPSTSNVAQPRQNVSQFNNRPTNPQVILQSNNPGIAQLSSISNPSSQNNVNRNIQPTQINMPSTNQQSRFRGVGHSLNSNEPLCNWERRLKNFGIIIGMILVIGLIALLIFGVAKLLGLISDHKILSIFIGILIASCFGCCWKCCPSSSSRNGYSRIY